MVEYDDMITYEDFQKIEMRIGTIEQVSAVDNSEKLLRLVVDFGDEKRQVISGIAKYYNEEELQGKQFTFVTNLEPRDIMGLESQAMILATDEETSLLCPAKKVPNGIKIR